MRLYLKELRDEKHLSQNEISKKLDISESYYSLIESGDRQADMSLSLMKKLADAFSVSLEFIVEQENKLTEKAG